MTLHTQFLFFGTQHTWHGADIPDLNHAGAGMTMLRWYRKCMEGIVLLRYGAPKS